ncbi:MAG: hypothetical protein ABSE89_03465 [Sedimentisphaerales bacterium]
MKKGQLFRYAISYRIKERSRTFIISFMCSVALIFGASVHAAENKKNVNLTENDLKGIKKVAIVVEQKRDFELLYHRAMTAYGTASLLGGVGFDGDAIAHGIDKGKDKKAAAPMLDAVADVCCSSIFIESLSPLKKSTRFESIYIPDTNQKKNLSDYDATVTFTIDRWGLRLVEREANKVAAFVELEVKMVSSKDKSTIWNQREVIIGSRKETPQTFAADGKMLNDELRRTIKKAGLQMANALIYPANPDVSRKATKEKVKTGKVTALEINNSIDFKVGALSSVKPLKIEVGTFTDNRQITDRIGDLRNGFGGKAGEINTARRPPEIVREAIVSVFNKNGHITDSSEKDIAISGSVETYWFESQLRMSSWELMGTVDANMVVTDVRSGKILFNKRYSGHHNVTKGIFGPKDIINIMDLAMENLTDQISNDSELIEAIKNL